MMEAVVLHYGIVAIALGAGIEGEPFAIAAGILAERRWLSAWAAVAASAGGSFAIDQAWFHLARRFRASTPVARVSRRAAFARALALIERHPAWFALLFRFAYGLRAVAPAAAGVSRVPARLFAPLNAVAAIVWGGLFTAVGYLLGPPYEALERRFGATIATAPACLSVIVLWLALRRDAAPPPRPRR